MKKNMLCGRFLLPVLVGIISSYQAVAATAYSASFQWLGSLPSDDFYSTMVMRISRGHGVIVKEHSTLISSDEGRSWIELKTRVPFDNISSAWLTPSLQLLRLFNESLLVSEMPGAEVQEISLREENVSYMAVAATANLGQIFVVGGRSIDATPQELENTPQYARDSTTDTPRTIVPIVHVSKDHGNTWNSVYLEHAAGYLDNIVSSNNYVIAWGPYVVYASADAGNSWRLMKMGIPFGEEDSYPVSGLIVANRAYISLKNGRLLRGEIDGEALRPFARLSNAISHLTFTGSCVGFGISPSIMDGEDMLMETINGGESWTPTLRARRIVALTAFGSDVYGATQNRAFHLHFVGKLPSQHCSTLSK